jgi:hypothetical protein
VYGDEADAEKMEENVETEEVDSQFVSQLVKTTGNIGWMKRWGKINRRVRMKKKGRRMIAEEYGYVYVTEALDLGKGSKQMRSSHMNT